MKIFSAVVERCPETGLYVGYIPGIPGAHSQGKAIEELVENLKEVLELLEETGDLKFESEFVGIQNIMVG